MKRGHIKITGEAQPGPFMVFSVDELAELMIGGGRDARSKLVRLAHMGRVDGIHLVLCIQQATVEAVTGLLKANTNRRIAFAIAYQTDSRLILDDPGDRPC